MLERGVLDMTDNELLLAISNMLDPLRQDVKELGFEHSSKINFEHTFHAPREADFLKSHCILHSHLPPFIRSM